MIWWANAPPNMSHIILIIEGAFGCKLYDVDLMNSRLR